MKKAKYNMKNKAQRMMWIILMILAVGMFIYYTNNARTIMITSAEWTEEVMTWCDGGNQTICHSLAIGWAGLSMNTVLASAVSGFMIFLLILGSSL